MSKNSTKYSEELINKIMEATSAIIVGLDKNHIVRIFNQSAEKITGYKKEEVIGKSWFDIFIQKELKDEIDAVWESAWDTKSHSFFNSLVTKSGKVRTISWQTSPLFEGDDTTKHLLISIGEDITERERAKEMLRRNELSMRNLFNAMKDVVFEMDYEGRYLYIAPTSTELMYKPPDDLLGRKLHDIFPKRQADELLKLVRDCISGDRAGSIVYSLEIQSKKYWFEGRAFPIEKNRVLFIAADITQRKIAEDTVQQRDNYLSALNHTNDVLYDGNIDINYSEFVKIVGEVSRASRTYIFKNHKSEKGELLLSQVAEYVAEGIKPEIDNPQLQNMAYDDFIPRWKEMLSSGDIIKGKVSGFPKNERAILEPQNIKSILVMPIIADDDFWGFIGFDNCIDDTGWDNHEIEYLKAAKEKLEICIVDNRNRQALIIAKERAEASEIKFRAITEQATEGITITDLKGNYILVNPAFCTMTGYSNDELLKMTVLDMLENSEGVKMDPDKFGIPMEYNLKRKNNTVFPVRIIINPIIIGLATYLLGMVTDITKQKEVEYELIKAKERAELSDRLKSAFLSNMSHEIRTPMNGILGFATLLKEPHLNGEERIEYIKIIEKSGERLLNTINDIVDMSRIEAGQVEVVNSVVPLNEVLDEMYNFFKLEAGKKGLKLSSQSALSDDDAQIVTDKLKLESVLTNLIKNAIKYTKQGEVKFGYSIKAEKGKRELEFYVKDTGIGIPPDRIEAIFNRFEQADIEDTRVYEGSGLGLAISKSYAEMLGGYISVESKEGVGSTFIFKIPYVKLSKKKKKTAADKDNNSLEDLSNLTVIVAEDDDTSQLYMEALFRDKFRKVIYTQTGKDTVAKCRENPDIDLILMDIKMPDMSGYTATREIRKFNKKVIIIAQTAFGLTESRVMALEAGCNDYVSKPIEKKLLFEKILLHVNR